MNKNKLKAVDLKIFIIPLVIITGIFLGVDAIMIKSIKNYYFNHMKEESLNFAKSYSHSLTKASEAYEIVNGLLEEKLLVASKMTVSSYGHHSNEVLTELANNLKVDEIYTYNPQGEIIYSNKGEYLGWKAYEEHPVYDFMISNSRSLVEDIRQDTESGVYYKYAYLKLFDGHFVQIGVLADKIQNFLGAFEMHQLLDEMKKDGVVAQIYFIDNDFNVLGSTDNELVGRKVTNREVKTAIDTNEEYGFINNLNGENVYEVFVPVYFQDKKIGTLCVIQSLKDTEEVVRQITILGLVTLSIIYASLLYGLTSTYNKNKKLINLAYYDSLTGLPNKAY
ncbi:MAG: hypothetical protein PHY90_12900, partial [Desulfitobacteriaceae bacterium]|nr:hypothetical protein [Desulfitobacteriaceae bacterium]